MENILELKMSKKKKKSERLEINAEEAGRARWLSLSFIKDLDFTLRAMRSDQRC